MHHGMEGARVGDVLGEKGRDDQVEGPAGRELRCRRVREHGAIALRRLGQLGRREVGDLVVEAVLGDQLERDDRVRAASQLADPGHARVTGERLRLLREVRPQARPRRGSAAEGDSIGGTRLTRDAAGAAIRRPPSRSAGGGGSGSPARIAAGASVTIHCARRGAMRAAASTPARSPLRGTWPAVGVGGDDVRELVAHELERQPPRARAALGRGQRDGGDLEQGAVLDQRRKPLPVALERRAALRMGQQDAIAADADVEEEVLEALGQLAVGRLDEQVVAALPERHRPQLVVAGPLRPQEVDLPARDQVDVEAGLRRRARELADAAAELSRDDRGWSGRTCGVAASVTVPSSTAAASSASEPGRSAGPSSMPGSTCVWRSITGTNSGASSDSSPSALKSGG